MIALGDIVSALGGYHDLCGGISSVDFTIQALYRVIQSKLPGLMRYRLSGKVLLYRNAFCVSIHEKQAI